MTTSAWGVDHGVEISKRREKYTRNEKITGLATGLTHTTPVGPVAAGLQAKKGKGAKVGWRAAGRGMAEGGAGSLAGAAVGHAASRGNPVAASVGASLVGAPLTAHGTMASMRNSRKKGWMKESKVSKSDKARRHIAAGTLAGAASPLLAAGYSGFTAKKGKRTKSALTTGGSSLLGGIAGGVAGARFGTAGSVAGSVAGGGAGGYLGSVRNAKKGRISGLKAEKYPMDRSKPKSVSKAFAPKNDKQRKNQANKKMIGGAGVAGLGVLAARRGGKLIGEGAEALQLANRLGGRAGEALANSAGRAGLRGFSYGGAGVAGTGAGAGLAGSGYKDRKKISKAFLPARGTQVTSSGSADTRTPGVKTAKGKQKSQKDVFTGRKSRSGSLIEAIGNN